MSISGESTLSGQSYVRFLAQLRPVAEKAGIKIENKTLSTFESLQNDEGFCSAILKSSIDEAVKASTVFSKDSLIKYAAAMTSNNSQLALAFLAKRIKEILTDSDKDQSIEKFKATLLKINQAVVWPTLDSKQADDLIHYVSSKTIDLLVSELSAAETTARQITAEAFAKGYIKQTLEVFDMTAVCDKMAWQDLINNINNANSLKITSRVFDTLLKRFENDPSLNSLITLVALSNKLALSERYRDEYGFFNKFPGYVIKAWESCYMSTPSQIEFGGYLTNLLIGIYKDSTQSDIRNYIASLFDKQLRLIKAENNELRSFSDAEVTKTHYLIAYLEKGKEQFSFLCRTAIEILKMLKDEQLIKNCSKNQRILLLEVYVILSHLVDVNDYYYFCSLEAPLNHYDPVYVEMSSIILACGFASGGAKQKFYNNLFEYFKNYTLTDPNCPLPKLLLGTMTQKDILGQDIFLTPYILKCKGIMEEGSISENMKEDLFTILLEGKLGGYTPALIESLKDCYSKEISRVWKLRCLKGLADLAEYQWNGGPTKISHLDAIGNPKMKELARKALQELKGKFEAELIVVPQEDRQSMPEIPAAALNSPGSKSPKEEKQNPVEAPTAFVKSVEANNSLSEQETPSVPITGTLEEDLGLT